ncbi:hypothetical protein BT69DRAFT_1332989 [Atractiella rhizophila]|nr:hypothetical protein BT69DRAFT_1332989 [Atractiella rhizophila]
MSHYYVLSPHSYQNMFNGSSSKAATSSAANALDWFISPILPNLHNFSSDPIDLSSVWAREERKDIPPLASSSKHPASAFHSKVRRSNSADVQDAKSVRSSASYSTLRPPVQTSEPGRLYSPSPRIKAKAKAATVPIPSTSNIKDASSSAKRVRFDLESHSPTPSPSSHRHMAKDKERGKRASKGFEVPMDIYESSTSHTFYLPLPGLTKTSLSIALTTPPSETHKVLTISGEFLPLPEDEKPEEVRVRAKGRPVGKFEKRIKLLPSTMPADVKAKMSDGLLRVEVMKPKRSRDTNVVS